MTRITMLIGRRTSFVAEDATPLFTAYATLANMEAQDPANAWNVTLTPSEPALGIMLNEGAATYNELRAQCRIRAVCILGSRDYLRWSGWWDEATGIDVRVTEIRP